MATRPDKIHPLIRRLGHEDVDRIYAIEKLAYPFPWTRSLFEDCMNAGYTFFGLQIGKDLAGYTVINWAAGEAHLLNLCVHPDWQHRGYGSLVAFNPKHIIFHVSLNVAFDELVLCCLCLRSLFCFLLVPLRFSFLELWGTVSSLFRMEYRYARHSQA